MPAINGMESSPSIFIQKLALKPAYGSAWIGCCRLLACTANVVMIIGMYLEYLWAAEWEEIPPHCDNRNQLPWLDFANCYHRYTFSHAMVRGQNIFIFGVVGIFAAASYITVEASRVRGLRTLLESYLSTVDAADRQDQHHAASKVLRILPVYVNLMTVAFVGVLLLAPFHLGRPMLHYATTGLACGSMFLGVCMYISMPLGKAVGLSHEDERLELAGVNLLLRQWAQRHRLLQNWSCILVALHIALPTAAALHHFAWVDVTGRLFGGIEVLTILSYQFFVGYLASDDFALESTDLQEPCGSDVTLPKGHSSRKEASKPKPTAQWRVPFILG